jgi:hypothetical protein
MEMRNLLVDHRVGGRRGSRCVTESLLVGVCLTAALILGIGFTASPAGAGEYHVYSCRMPTGAVAPVSGWSTPTNGPWLEVTDSCESGGSLTAALDGNVSHPANVSAATWIFSAQAGTQIAAAKLWRSAYARSWEAGNNSTETQLEAPGDTTTADVFSQCVRFEGCESVGNSSVPLSEANLVAAPLANLTEATHLYVNALCGGGGSCPAVGSGYAASISLYAADITLTDDTPPTISGVGGSLAVPGTLSGIGDIFFSATDTGSGLYEATFLIDGRAVSKQLLNSAGGPCRNVGGTSDGSNAFFDVEPCPLALSDDLSFDTALAPDGPHLFTVQLLDAADNATTILNRQVTFANHTAGGPAGAGIGPGSPLTLRGTANGMNTSDQAKLTARWSSTAKATLTSGYGQADRITGRLMTPGGVVISGASLSAYETPSYGGARTVPLGKVRTGSTGGWALTLPLDISSGALRFEYRSHQNDTIPAATAALTLRVHAGIAMRIAPRVTSVGRRILFSGVLHGAPIPPGGKQLVLEANSGGEWVQFHTITTDAKGRYHASYRFKFPGPVSYRFRVYSPHEADFPFLGGASNVVGVYER